MAEPKSSRGISSWLLSAKGVDAGLWALSFLSGVCHPSGPLFYDSFLRSFLLIAVPLFSLCYLSYRIAESGARIQGERKMAPPIGREAYGTFRAVFVVSCLAAWPVGLYRLGRPTGMAWTLEEMGLTWWQAVAQMWAGIVVVDAWTYWKHRLLHSKLFFGFHRHHHSFLDPTPFASFAVGPLESLLTFWPVVLICIPQAKHYAPLYFSAIASFVLLNLYLHCGVTYSMLEAVLPKLGLNSSAWHNLHHSSTKSNFGEVSYVWDLLCKTSYADMKRKKVVE